MAVKRTLDIRQTSGYRMLTTEQKKAVDYELTNNSQYYQTDPDSGRSAATKATNLISQAKELGDSYTFTTPQPSKYSFNVYNSDGSVNEAWQQAYEDLGLYRNYLKLSSSGAPKEDNSQDPRLPVQSCLPSVPKPLAPAARGKRTADRSAAK